MFSCERLLAKLKRSHDIQITHKLPSFVTNVSSDTNIMKHIVRQRMLKWMEKANITTSLLNYFWVLLDAIWQKYIFERREKA